jgi:hypothetical protein
MKRLLLTKELGNTSQFMPAEPGIERLGTTGLLTDVSALQLSGFPSFHS